MSFRQSARAQSAPMTRNKRTYINSLTSSLTNANWSSSNYDRNFWEENFTYCAMVVIFVVVNMMYETVAVMLCVMSMIVL